jgi:hypothetical protein
MQTQSAERQTPEGKIAQISISMEPNCTLGRFYPADSQPFDLSLPRFAEKQISLIPCSNDLDDPCPELINDDAKRASLDVGGIN